MLIDETVLAKPSTEIDCDESMNLLKCVTDSIIAEDREMKDQHKVFMRNSCDLFKYANCNIFYRYVNLTFRNQGTFLYYSFSLC